MPTVTNTDELPYLSQEPISDEALCIEYGLKQDFNKTLIKSYTSNVLDTYKGFKKVKEEPNTPLFFGVELEICVLNRYPGADDTMEHGIVHKVLKSLSGRAIVCHDGSVTAGFEIVTIPATLNYHKTSMWNNFFNPEITNHLVGMPYCGNHVHVSKAAWTPLSVGKLLSFMHSDENSDFLDVISSRGQTSYCTRNHSFNKVTSVFREGHNRTSAVNITPSQTIEFRLFKSSINPANLLKNLEFIDALRMFTFHSKISDMRSDKYLEFVKANHYMWPYLTNFLIKNNQIVIERKIRERSAA